MNLIVLFHIIMVKLYIKFQWTQFAVHKVSLLYDI